MNEATAYAFAWISTAIAVIVAVWITKNPNCLWALLLPAGITISHSSQDNSDLR